MKLNAYIPTHENNLPNVLVFDSGVGGLSITKELTATLPAINITYAADNAAFPYGTKSEGELIARVDSLLHRLQQVTAADLIVVACNTASTLTLPVLRKRFSIPIVGVVPAIKPAAKLSQSKVMGLLATPATVARNYTDELIAEFASDCNVIKVGSHNLVNLAEAKLAGETIDPKLIKQEISLLIEAKNQQQLDTIVLACTHFPLLKPELMDSIPGIPNWIDSSEAIARRVDSLLYPKNEFFDNSITTKSRCHIYQSIFTKPPSNPLFLQHYLSSWFSENWTLMVD